MFLNKLSIELHFNGKLNNQSKIILKNEFEKTEENNYIVKSEIIKYRNSWFEKYDIVEKKVI